MKRRIPALAMATAAVLIATGVELGTIIALTPNSTPAKTSQATTAANFTNSMKLTNGARFVATYRLSGYLILQNGAIAISQIPSPPGTKVTTNVDGYSGTGRYAYLFQGSTGRIVQ
ncbi:MAG TPA: hypothetical protein VIJ40_11460 [Acidimicrobiales bacterium]